MKIAVFPGSFDPVTAGHVDVAERAAQLFDKVCVCAMVNSDKSGGMFTSAQRVELLKIALSHLPNVEVESYSGLLADYAREKGAAWLVKGIRNSRDFESELEMYQVNRHLGDLETVFLPARPEHLLCSSTVVRELLRYEQSTEHYLPSAVAVAAKEFLK